MLPFVLDLVDIGSMRYRVKIQVRPDLLNRFQSLLDGVFLRRIVGYVHNNWNVLLTGLEEAGNSHLSPS